MSKAVKLKNSLYLASTSIVHKRGGGWYYLNNLLDNIYPVGSIFISTVNTNPSTYFGGTWEAFGTGRVLVGLDTSQTEFNTLLKTGGSKYIQEHSHYTYYSDFPIPEPAGGYGVATNTEVSPGAAVYTKGVRGVNTGNSGNLQPYIVVKMWKRVS